MVGDLQVLRKFNILVLKRSYLNIFNISSHAGKIIKKSEGSNPLIENREYEEMFYNTQRGATHLTKSFESIIIHSFIYNKYLLSTYYTDFRF